jgi:hypothetical protein
VRRQIVRFTAVGCMSCRVGAERPDWCSQSSGLQEDVEDVGRGVRGLIGVFRAVGCR